MKNYYLIKKKKLFINTINKKDLQRSYKIYDFIQKNKFINKKIKKKFIKKNLFKNRIL